jgi:membrane-associated protein
MNTIISLLLHTDQYLGTLIQSYGIFVYIILFLIIFAETGLVVTPFLPGDSLLFIAGTFAAVGSLNIYALAILLCAAAILGNTTNYWIGRTIGEKVFSKFIKKEHLEKTKLFYEKHGKKTIIISRFMPIVRTLAPFVAGVGKMNHSTFSAYNIIGGILWGASFTFAGYFFGNFQFVKNNLTLIVIIIVLLSITPGIIASLKRKS